MHGRSSGLPNNMELGEPIEALHHLPEQKSVMAENAEEEGPAMTGDCSVEVLKETKVSFPFKKKKIDLLPTRVCCKCYISSKTNINQLLDKKAVKARKKIERLKNQPPPPPPPHTHTHNSLSLSLSLSSLSLSLFVKITMIHFPCLNR